MKLKNVILSIFIFLIVPAMVLAVDYTVYDYTISVPANNTILTDRFVNYTYSYALTNSNSTLLGGGMNTSIWRNGTEMFTPINLTNATLFNWTQNLPDGDYEWYINVTNGTATNISKTYYFSVDEPAPTDYVISILAPAEYQVLTSTAVNFSYEVSAEGNVNSTDLIQCSVYNKSVRSHNYSILFSANVTDTTNMTNGTFFNYTATVPEGRLYWYVNCTNTFQTDKTFESTTMRVFDTDADYYTLTFGIAQKINFSLDTGEVAFSSNITLRNETGSPFNCGVTNTGIFQCLNAT